MNTRLACVASALCAGTASAQTDSIIVVTPGFSAQKFVATGAHIALTLSRPPTSAEGTVAVMVGTTDITTLFERRSNQLVYSAAMPLPSGESEVAIYLVSDDAWKELGRFPLRVLTPRGFTSASVTPSVSTSNSGPLAKGSSGAPPSSELPSFGDVQLTAGLRTSHVRRGWTFETQENALGATDPRQALRFGERGQQAPLVDLSDYVVSVQRGVAKLALGNASLGNSRHLMNAFGSRGVTATVGIPALSVSLGALGGSAIVGFNDLLGATRSSHRVAGATLAAEVRPSRPGAIHLDATLVNGSLQPRTGFTQNALTDAERSTGAGLQLLASTSSQRVKVAAGVAMSRFVNPADSLLSGGDQTVAVTPARKTARYIETTFAVLQNVKVHNAQVANLVTGWRHERIDPLFRSVAATTAPDILSNALDVNGNIGTLAIQASHSRSSDNLGRLPSILRTLSRASAAQAGLPLASVLRIQSRQTFWPTLSYSFNQTHQYGAGIPVNAGFTASDVPDQLGSVHTANAEWQSERIRTSYRYNYSLQDNRQVGHEHSDLSAVTHTLTFAINALPSLDVGLDLSAERRHNVERDERGTMNRLGLITNWRPRDGTALTGNVTVSRAGDRPRVQRSDNTEARFEFSQRLALLPGIQKRGGQLFLRFSRESANTFMFANTDPLTGASRRAAWTLVTGLNLQVL